MAFRSLTRPVGLAYKPCNRITPSLFSLNKPYSATPNINNKKADSEQTTTPTNKAEEIKDDALKATEKVEEAAKDEKDDIEEKEDKKEHGYAYGAHHWNMERGAAVALIPLVSTQFIYGAHPVVDGLMGVVLPYHIYMGFDSCITDYIPKRVYPRLHKVANWTLTGTTGLVMWGCYEFNTEDIGITEFMTRLFTA